MECFKHVMILDRKEQVNLFMVTIIVNFHSKIMVRKLILVYRQVYYHD
jgi:hypothetical protein